MSDNLHRADQTIDAIQIQMHGRASRPQVSPGQQHQANQHSGRPRLQPDWWSQTESNRRPPACKAGALPTELWPRFRSASARASARQPSRRAALPGRSSKQRRLVGLGRFELPTSRLSSARSNQLSYKPKKVWSPVTGRVRARKAFARARRRGLVHEEREMKTAVSRLWTEPILKPVGPDVSKRSDRGRVRRL
jgi:hypothetical protein